MDRVLTISRVGGGINLAYADPAPLGVDDAARIAQALHAARAPSTLRVHFAAWRRFEAFAAARSAAAAPASPGLVAAYLAHLAEGGLALATVRRAAVVIAVAHKRQGLDDPCAHPLVRETLRGLGRLKGRPQRQAHALSPTEILGMVETLGTDARAVMARAVLLLGFAAALRRAELVALDLGDVTLERAGLRVVIRRSKTDQQGRGALVGVPYSADERVCPVRAWTSWLSVRAGLGAPTEGPAFLACFGARVSWQRASDRYVCRLVARAARAAGLDPRACTGHSLRAGFATSAARLGKRLDEIRAQTRHASLSVLARYIRDATLVEGSAAVGVLDSR